ncbi:MAG: diacylglycerol kinase family protein [Patescibacteria group bacterium]
MYYYLVDPLQFEGKNFEFYQTQLLSLLGEYHIAGEVARVTKLRTVRDLVGTAISRGATTLVVVGGDETFSEVISLVHAKQISLGYIPLRESEIGKILGISSLAEAVGVIAKRRVENLDLARVGSTYFISNLQFGYFAPMPAGTGAPTGFGSWFRMPEVEAELTFDGSFNAAGKFLGGSIINCRFAACPQVAGKVLGNPKDELLDVVLATSLSRFAAWRNRKLLAQRCFESLPGGSVIHAKKIEIKNPEGLPIYLSGKIVAHAPAVVEMTAEKLPVIVGRNRQF